MGIFAIYAAALLGAVIGFILAALCFAARGN